MMKRYCFSTYFLLATFGSEGPVFLSLRLELGLDFIFRLLYRQRLIKYSDEETSAD